MRQRKNPHTGTGYLGYLSNDIQIDLDELFDKVIAAGSENYFRADSIEELAEQIQVPADALKATVEKYNDDCAGGYDSLFNKKRKLCPVKRSKILCDSQEATVLMEV